MKLCARPLERDRRAQQRKAEEVCSRPKTDRIRVRMGSEAPGQARWFERLLGRAAVRTVDRRSRRRLRPSEYGTEKRSGQERQTGTESLPGRLEKRGYCRKCRSAR